MASWYQGPGAALDERAVLVLAEHVADGGEQYQVVSLAKFCRAHVPGSDADTVLQSRLANVALAQKNHRSQIQNLRAQFGTSLGKGDGKGARSAAHVEHSLRMVDAREAHGFFGAVLSPRVHGGNEVARALFGEALGAARLDRPAHLHAFGEGGPRVPQMNRVQQAWPRRPQRLRLGGAAKDGIALQKRAQRHECVQQHLGGARLCAQALGDICGRGAAFPDRREHVQFQGREQHSTFLEGSGRLDQIG
jgi:hypothetical protein